MTIHIPSALEHAKLYLEKGFSVIPVCRGSKKPALESWKPYQNRKPTEAELIEWFGNEGHNVGIVTGGISGLAVLDFDTDDALKFAKANNFPQTSLVKTGRGYHAYFRYKEGVRNFQKRDDLPGIDLRGDGGYVIAPPSIHVSGRKYEWVEGRSLDDLPLAYLPEIVLARTPQDKTPVRELFAGVPEGQRNDTLARIAGALFEQGLGYAETFGFCLAWNERNSPPLPEREVKNTVESIFKAHQKNSSPLPDKIRAVSITEFLRLDFPPRENVLDPWLPTQGLAMIHAKRGVGKTHVGLGIAVAVASGGEFLRWAAQKPRGVLFLDGEMPAVVMQDRLAHIIRCVDQEPTAPLNIITPDLQPCGMPNLTAEEGQEAIEDHLEGISIVIVDNISTLCRGGRENEAESWLPVQAWALRLRTRGISVLFIHHGGKSGAQRGTSRREDILDTVINLKHAGDYQPDQGAYFEVHFEKARGIYGDEVKPFEAKLITDQYGKQEWTIKDLEESLTTKVADLINDGVPQSEIAELLGVTKGTVSKHKKKAQNLGQIT